MIPRSMLLALSWGTLSIVGLQSGNLPPQQLPVYGGSGGTGFSRSCGAGKVLTGLRGRAGQVVDAVGVLCRPVNSNGTLGSETTVGTLAGGGGGSTVVIHCNSGEVVIGAQIFSGSFVDRILIHCKSWIPKTRTFDTVPGGHYITLGSGSGGTSGIEHCESAKQPANDIRGRASVLLDAIGLICDEP